jgi:hypothetical protein
MAKKKMWIANAVKNKGGLHASLGIKPGKKIPASKLVVKKSDSPKVVKQKNLAKTLKSFRKKGR